MLFGGAEKIKYYMQPHGNKHECFGQSIKKMEQKKPTTHTTKK